MIRVIAIFAMCFIVFNFIFKILFSLFNSTNNNHYKKTEARKTNININGSSKAKNKSKADEYIDYEEIK